MFDFPNTPTNGQIISGPGNIQYRWDGKKWASAVPPSTVIPVNSGVLNVRDYGAKGDGVTDDATAVQAALDAVPASGATVLLPGMCLISQAVRLNSFTRLTGIGPGSGLLGSATMLAGPLVRNQNNGAVVITDHNIAIDNLTLDFGAATGGGRHAAEFVFCRNVTIQSVTFQCRGRDNATAFIGCDNTLTQGCSAFDFVNCAYDHWWGPKNARVLGCYGQTAHSAQIVNFNPEPTSGPATGLVADTLVLADCTFEVTAGNACPLQLEPLGAGTTVKNVVVTGNTFRNCLLAIRGAVSAVIVNGNTFLSARGGNGVVLCYSANGGIPSDITITGNGITDPDTVPGNVAVLRIWADGAVVTGNRVSGSGFTASVLDVQTFPAVVIGNSFPSSAVSVMPNALSGASALVAPVVTVTNALTALTANFGSNTGGTIGLGINGAQGNQRMVNCLTANVVRWKFGADASGESVGNAGSNFVVNRYSDVGANIGTVLNIVRATGNAAFSGDVAAISLTVNAGPTIRAGTGAATGTQPAGSMWLRTDGAVGSRIYVSAGAGTWAAIAGV